MAFKELAKISMAFRELTPRFARIDPFLTFSHVYAYSDLGLGSAEDLVHFTSSSISVFFNENAVAFVLDEVEPLHRSGCSNCRFHIKE